MTRCSVAAFAASAAAVCLFAAGPARGEDAELARAVERCTSLVEQRKWKLGYDAARGVLERWSGDPELRTHVPVLEEVLKRCAFQQQFPPPSPEELFGARRFDHATREIELWFLSAPKPREPPSSYISPMPLENDVTVKLEFDIRWSRALATDGLDSDVSVVTSHDPVRGTGYLFVVGYHTQDRDLEYFLDQRIVKLSPAVEVLDDEGPPPLRNQNMLTIECERKGSALRLKRDGKVVARASDRDFRAGHVAVVVETSVRFAARITGRVLEQDYEEALERVESAALREWVAASYRREDHLPAWLREAGWAGGSSSARRVLPAGITGEEEQRLLAALEAADAGDDAVVRSFAEAGASTTSLVARRLLDGLLASADGRWRAARTAFEDVIAVDRECAVAYAHAALAAYRMGDDAGAEAAVARALELDGRAPTAHLVRVLLPWRRNDLKAAEAAFAAARQAGVQSSRLGAVGAVLERVREGPLGASHVLETEHYRVVSDFPGSSWEQTGDILEDAHAAFEAVLGSVEARGPSRGCLLYRDAQAREYAGDWQSACDMSDGRYLPETRELLLVEAFDDERFARKARHMAFHQYIHRWVDCPPPWLEEGLARHFELTARLRGARGMLSETGEGEVRAEAVAELRAARPKMPTVAALAQMDRKAFRSRPAVHRPASWALADLLVNSGGHRLWPVLQAYLARIAAGDDLEEAYAATLAPREAELQAAFEERVALLAK